VRVVHGLEGNAGVIAVEVAVLDEVLDRIDDLEALISINRVPGLRMYSQFTFFSKSACSRRASSTADMLAVEFSYSEG
jgi:hypothetical protein